MSYPLKNKHFLPVTISLAVALLILATLFLGACQAEEGVTKTALRTRPVTRAAPTRPSEVIVVRPTEMPEVMVTVTLPGDMIFETEHFAFYAEDGSRPVDVELFAKTAEAIYAEVSTKMGAGSPESIILSLQPPRVEPCRARGMMFNDESGPRVTIFADEQTEGAQIQGVLAHELAHVIQANGFERMLGGDRNLTEGLATWLTRDYWTVWQQAESLDELVRGYLASGDYVPLTEADVFSAYPRVGTNHQENCLALRDLLYAQWASFVGYLVETYGWETFLDLMASAAPEVTDEGEVLPVPTDYQGTYGKGLEELEGEWLAEIGRS